MDRSGTTNTCQDPTGTSGVAQCRGNSTALHSCDSDVTTTHHLRLGKGFEDYSLKWAGTIFSYRTGSKDFVERMPIVIRLSQKYPELCCKQRLYTMLTWVCHWIWYRIIFFFLYNRRYNPWWVLACFTISFHNLLSLHFSLQFLTFIFFISSSTWSSHLSLGLPTGLDERGSHSVIFFNNSCCVHSVYMCCPS